MSSRITLATITESLERDATELVEARRQEASSESLFRRTSRTVVHACRLLFNANALGAEVLSLLSPGTPGFGLDVKDDKQVLWYWRRFAVPFLIGIKKMEFAGGAGEAEFARPLTDKEGRVVGKSGRPLTVGYFDASEKPLSLGIVKKDGSLRRRCTAEEAVRFDLEKLDSSVRVLGANGKPLRRLGKGDHSKRIGAPATEADDFDETTHLAKLREQAKDWADACRAAATIIREKVPGKTPDAAGLTFLPGAFVYRGLRISLSGKPLDCLKALNDAQGKTLTLAALRDKVWGDTEIGEETIRSALKAARKSLREAIAAEGIEGPSDPLRAVDRGTDRTAWRLDLP